MPRPSGRGIEIKKQLGASAPFKLMWLKPIYIIIIFIHDVNVAAIAIIKKRISFNLKFTF